MPQLCCTWGLCNFIPGFTSGIITILVHELHEMAWLHFMSLMWHEKKSMGLWSQLQTDISIIHMSGPYGQNDFNWHERKSCMTHEWACCCCCLLLQAAVAEAAAACTAAKNDMQDEVHAHATPLLKALPLTWEKSQVLTWHDGIMHAELKHDCMTSHYMSNMHDCAEEVQPLACGCNSSCCLTKERIKCMHEMSWWPLTCHSNSWMQTKLTKINQVNLNWRVHGTCIPNFTWPVHLHASWWKRSWGAWRLLLLLLLQLLAIAGLLQDIWAWHGMMKLGALVWKWPQQTILDDPDSWSWLWEHSIKKFEGPMETCWVTLALDHECESMHAILERGSNTHYPTHVWKNGSRAAAIESWATCHACTEFMGGGGGGQKTLLSKWLRISRAFLALEKNLEIFLQTQSNFSNCQTCLHLWRMSQRKLGHNEVNHSLKIALKWPSKESDN